ncbi:Uncharacterised protein [Bordetella pertussis]|nr:Uncharacterised protein [Bordetella pertussis]CFM79473.1 Uncharacterised protein [Bordetella pertussis]CFN22881.1 Uncharacterised protein [Bordetella pertussis]CFN44425.1 Uncharacterised protein [Bordetella pertussis]CFN71615.1 Uncharacterised protein [Bordetella pertussis]
MRLGLARFAPPFGLVPVAQQAQLNHQGRHQRTVELFPAAAAQVARQHDIAETRTDQAADGHTHRLEHAAHLAVAPLLQGDAIPAIAAVAPQVFERTESRLAVLQLDTLGERLALRVVHLAQDAHRVFALGTVARMHDAVGHVAGGREDQQPLGIEVQPPHGQPLAGAQLGQPGKHAGASARVIMADDLAGRLVIEDDARRLLGVGARNRLAVDAHLVVGSDALADVGRLAVDRHPAGHDQFFHFAARTDSGIGQHLVQLGHHCLAVQVLAQALLDARRVVQVGQRLVGIALAGAGIALGLGGGLAARLVGAGFASGGRVAATAAKRRAQLAATRPGSALAVAGLA